MSAQQEVDDGEGGTRLVSSRYDSSGRGTQTAGDGVTYDEDYFFVDDAAAATVADAADEPLGSVSSLPAPTTTTTTTTTRADARQGMRARVSSTSSSSSTSSKPITPAQRDEARTMVRQLLYKRGATAAGAQQRGGIRAARMVTLALLYYMRDGHFVDGVEVVERDAYLAESLPMPAVIEDILGERGYFRRYVSCGLIPINSAFENAQARGISPVAMVLSAQVRADKQPAAAATTRRPPSSTASSSSSTYVYVEGEDESVAVERARAHLSAVIVCDAQYLDDDGQSDRGNSWVVVVAPTTIGIINSSATANIRTQPCHILATTTTTTRPGASST
ncbi:hypothetical protein U1Q18_051593 [Sarracenia purpurea var. burkii]